MSIGALRSPIVTPIPAAFRAAIEAAIDIYPQGRLSAIVATIGHPLAIKYVAAKWAKSFTSMAPGSLKISTTPGFTWGTGTYVTPLAFPLSSAIFGRIGVVARFDPTGWRVFDATQLANQSLYLDWIRIQPLYVPLALTTHSSLANQYLRDLFRTTFQIDCVLFHPDQFNAVYTDPLQDVWMNVTDWTTPDLDREIKRDMSARLSDVRFAVIINEEFSPDANDIERSTLIGPLSPRPPDASIMSQIINAYFAKTFVYIDA